MIMMLKSLFQKPLFWILTVGIIAVIIGVIFLPFQPNESQFVLKPMPKEDLEVRMENGKQIVDAKKDGYELLLDPELIVFTREIESGRVMIYKGDNCEVDVSKFENTENMTVQEWFQEDKAGEVFAETLLIKDYHIEKITNTPLDAYYRVMESEEFGVEKSILIQGKDGIYSISESNADKKCLPIEEILKDFHFKK
jgi:hypothetical protein